MNNLRNNLKNAFGMYFEEADNEKNYRKKKAGMFKDLDATELYCSKCRRSVPVKKYLLLVLPEGDKYEYRCVYCSESVGTKIDKNIQPISVVL